MASDEIFALVRAMALLAEAELRAARAGVLVSADGGGARRLAALGTLRVLGPESLHSRPYRLTTALISTDAPGVVDLREVLHARVRGSLLSPGVPGPRGDARRPAGGEVHHRAHAAGSGQPTRSVNRGGEGPP